MLRVFVFDLSVNWFSFKCDIFALKSACLIERRVLFHRISLHFRLMTLRRENVVH